MKNIVVDLPAEGTFDDVFSKPLSNALHKCLKQGMRPPLILCAVNRHGDICAMRLDSEFNKEMLVAHNETGETILPIHCVVVDQSGESALLTITCCTGLRRNQSGPPKSDDGLRRPFVAFIQFWSSFRRLVG